jgi:hypothetical protein
MQHVTVGRIDCDGVRHEAAAIAAAISAPVLNEISPLSAVELRRKRRMSALRSSLIALAILLAPAAAQAQGTPEQRKACEPDTKKFCRGLRPEPFIMLQCLQQHREKISAACQKVLKENGQ